MNDERQLTRQVHELLEATPDETMRGKMTRLFGLLITASDEDMKPDPRVAMFAFADAATALWGGDVLGVEVHVRVEVGKTHVYHAGEDKPHEFVLDVGETDTATLN